MLKRIGVLMLITAFPLGCGLTPEKSLPLQSFDPVQDCLDNFPQSDLKSKYDCLDRRPQERLTIKTGKTIYRRAKKISVQYQNSVKYAPTRSNPWPLCTEELSDLTIGIETTNTKCSHWHAVANSTPIFSDECRSSLISLKKLTSIVTGMCQNH